MTKGSKVYIEGKLKTRSYDKDGVKMYTTEIVASELQMLDGKGDKPQAQPVDNGFDDGDDIPFN